VHDFSINEALRFHWVSWGQERNVIFTWNFQTQEQHVERKVIIKTSWVTGQFKLVGGPLRPHIQCWASHMTFMKCSVANWDTRPKLSTIDWMAGRASLQVQCIEECKNWLCVSDWTQSVLSGAYSWCWWITLMPIHYSTAKLVLCYLGL
jgi:hypothetical protein